jgi:uncharacterized protein (DUF2235 family)
MSDTADARARRGNNMPKRIIVCCDGTWMDQLGKEGYVTDLA